MYTPSTLLVIASTFSHVVFCLKLFFEKLFMQLGNRLWTSLINSHKELRFIKPILNHFLSELSEVNSINYHISSTSTAPIQGALSLLHALAHSMKIHS